MKWVMFIALFIVIVSLLNPETDKELTPEKMVQRDAFQMELRARATIKNRLKDPDSAKFESVYVKDRAVCGFVNAKNSFGGYSGREAFISTPSTTFMESDATPQSFKAAWEAKC